nr:unnamed protein product [Callosobruchus analis]
MGKSHNNIIKFGLLNVRSLLSDFNAFVDVLTTDKFDILAITETWLQKDIPLDTVSVNEYNFFCHNRDTRGGGVGIYINKQFKVEIIDLNIDSRPHLEQLWVKITIRRQIFVIGVLYRPPNQSVRECIKVSDSLLPIVMTYDNVIVVGDINVNLLNNANPITQCCESYGLINIVQQPTRVTSSSSTLLDPVFTNRSDIFSDCITFDVENISEHRLVTCDICIVPPVKQAKIITYRDFSNFDEAAFLEDLNAIDMSYIFRNSNIDEKVDIFMGVLMSLFDTHAPIRTVRVNRLKAPWLTYPLLQILKEKDKLRAQFKNDKSNHSLERYKEMRNFALASIRREKLAYLSYLEKQKNSKQLWSGLRDMGVHKMKSRNDFANCSSDPEVINNYFMSVFDPTPVKKNILDYYHNNKFSTKRFCFLPVEPDVIMATIQNIKSNSKGIDNLSLLMLKISLPVTLLYITHIVNICLEKGYFPEAWRRALVIPIPKVATVTDISDLRPISLLPILSKVLEKIAKSQISTYIEDCKILPERQSGFLEAHSTTSALLNLVDTVVEATDKKLAVAVLSVDYSKAFDKINHELLCAKLNYYGFDQRSLNFFRSYLTNREQCVCIKGVRSEMKPVPSGVPQGSVLGPLLFLIYTADLSKHTTFSEIHYYADDTQVVHTFRPEDARYAKENFEHDIRQVIQFSTEHNLSVNPAKSSVTLFCPENHREHIQSVLKLNIGSQALQFQDSIKILGVTIDNKLKFTTHIKNMMQKIFSKFRTLYAHRHILNFKLRKKLSEALVLSVFNYCSIVYFYFLNQQAKNRMQVVQNTCARFIFRLRKFDHVSELFVTLNWMRMVDLIRYHYIVFVHRIMERSRPSYLRDKLIFRRDTYSRRLRDQHSLSVPYHRTALFKNCFSYLSVKFYNSIDNTFKSLPSAIFKRKVNSFILDTSP